MSLAPPVPASSSGAHKPIRILACVLCQHRKIKCDRTFPCANCTKANVKCTPSTPAPARKRRRPNQDLQERLARCEELLKEYATTKPEETAAIRQGGSQAHDESPMAWNPTGKLIVEDDGGVRFMDSFLLGTVYDELKAMREIVDDDDNDAASPEASTTPDDNADLLMGSETPIASLEELQPDPGHIFRLWQIFCSRVNPLTKVIHVPTLQPYFVEATSGSQNLPKNVEALLFSIYTLATVSMSPDECMTLLGYSKEVALHRFSTGVRHSLNRMGFLKTYDLETLQALVIYMISLQGRYNRHAAWILNGAVIRIAQKMGLHKDGESLGLSPFETEMRRRVWWQLIMLDAKYALLSGLTHNLLPRGWDTKLPKNVNDADLFPAATEPIQDRDGPTEMILVLLTNRIARFLVDTPGIEPMMLISNADGFNGPNSPSTEQLGLYRTIVSDLATDMLSIIDKYSDPSCGPLHEMAIEMRSEILTKIQVLLSPAKDRQYASEIHNASDNAFSVAVSTTAHTVEQHMRVRDKGFSWYARLHFQLSVFQYMVGQLYYRKTGEMVEKAWEVVEGTYVLYPDLFDISQKGNYHLATFLLRAWRIREEVLRLSLGAAPETPEYVAKLQARMPDLEIKSEPSTGPPTDPANPAGKDDTMTDMDVEQLLGPYLDGSSLDWDMWGNMPTGSAMTAFGGFGMGPATEW